MKRALVMSGGSRLGAYEVGVVKALYEAGRHYDVFCGTSVGAINAAGLCQFATGNEADGILWLEQFWRAVRSEDIWQHWFLVRELSALWKKAVYNTEPLRQLIADHFDVDRARSSGKEWYAGLVSLVDGEYRAFGLDHPDPVAVCIASSSQPLFMLPQAVLVDEDPKPHLCLDGGLRGATPLRAAIKAGATDIDVVLTEADHPRPHPSEFDNAFEVGLRGLELMAHNLFELDLELTLKENILVQVQRTNSAKRHVNLNIYRPGEPLKNVGGPLSFDLETTEALITQGHEETLARVRVG